MSSMGTPRRLLEVLVLAALAALFAAWQVHRSPAPEVSPSPPPASPTASPGTSPTLGGVRPGDPDQVLLARWGEPDSRKKQSVDGMSDAVSPFESWEFTSDGRLVRSAFLMNGQVLTLISFDLPLEGPDGPLPGLGASLDEVRQALGEPARSDDLTATWKAAGGLGEITMHHEAGRVTQLVLSGVVSGNRVVP